ncbi:hypothetical protein RND81_02G194500 [Saponaria officinalis]|uniref:Uncharacterized protein n=1 Tax=Saponaria officinalis TaxID=3572 RepID=A0AAW1MS88_SAPOF
MELIPVINFEALNNPSLFSRIVSVFEFGKLSPAHRFWKWGAFLLAFVYAFNYVANKLKVLILHYHQKSKSFLANTQPLLSSTFDDELYSSDDEDDVVSASSDDDDDSDEEIEESKTRELNRFQSYEDFSKFEDDFTVKGQNRKFKVPRRKKSLGDDFSLSDLVNGNGIVKLWDGFGLGVESSFPFLEINKDDWKKFGSFFGSPEVVTTAERGSKPGCLGLNVWDFRCSMNEPVVHASWRSDRTGLTVGDVRMIETALTENVTEEGEEKWWDADGVSG